MKSVHYETLYSHEVKHWWYAVRRCLVHNLIRTYTNGSDLAILDIGCGTGALTKELERYGTATGIDFSQQAVDFCKSRGVKDVRLGSVEETGCPPDSFDAVLCLDVLEHLPDDETGMTEIYRVLKPGGTAIIFVPTFQSLWSVTDNVSQHYRRYRLPILVEKFERLGFTTLRRSYFNTFLFPLIALVRISVRLLGIKMESEAETGDGLVNKILFVIFDLERRCLKFMNFPFGVSGMIIAKKK